MTPRASTPVGSLTEMPRRSTVASVCVEAMPWPFGSEIWPGCNASLISTGASALPRREVRRTQSPSGAAEARDILRMDLQCGERSLLVPAGIADRGVAGRAPPIARQEHER
jgi:hypothetical protein